MVALLRAINVGGRKLPMADLRRLCAEIGWRDVETYIQSGNIVFAANGETPALETALESAIDERFGMKVPVIVRTADQWAAYSRSNPFPEVARDTPNHLLLYIPKQIPAHGAVEIIQARAVDGEVVKRAAAAIWIHYPSGSGRSKLSPTLIDKAIGTPATSRNYRTVMKLKEMLEGQRA